VTFLGTLLNEVGAKAIVDQAFAILKRLLGDAVTERGRVIISQQFEKEEWRVALFHFLNVELPASPSGYPREAKYLENLIARMARCEGAFVPGDEDRLSSLLAEYLEFLVQPNATADGERTPLDELLKDLPEQERERIFSSFANLAIRLELAEDEATAERPFSPFEVLATLEDDHIIQYARRLAAVARPVLEEVVARAAAFDAADAALAARIKARRLKISRKPWKLGFWRGPF